MRSAIPPSNGTPRRPRSLMQTTPPPTSICAARARCDAREIAGDRQMHRRSGAAPKGMSVTGRLGRLKSSETSPVKPSTLTAPAIG